MHALDLTVIKRKTICAYYAALVRCPTSHCPGCTQVACLILRGISWNRATIWLRVFCAKRYLRWRRNFERCPYVCLCVTDFSHFLQGYLHWGQAYAYWCFDQKVNNLLFFTKMNQFHQRVRGGNCGFRVPIFGDFH